MTTLVASLSTGKGTWGGVLKLSSSGKFDKSFLVINDWTKDNLKMDNPTVELIIINQNDTTEKMRDSIIAQLKGKIKDFEVALNLDSGSGKEHMAIITAIMNLGLSFRFVVFENDKIEEITQDIHFEEEFKE